MAEITVYEHCSCSAKLLYDQFSFYKNFTKDSLPDKNLNLKFLSPNASDFKICF